MLDYASTRNPGVQLKFGSCFEDLLSIRPYSAAQYDKECFDHDGVITGDQFGIHIHDDVDVSGGLKLMETCMMDQGRQLGHDINTRKLEGDAGKSAFARKPSDDVFRVDRPGSLYVVPSKFQTAIDFHHAHVSYYKKRKAYTDDEVGPSGHKKRSDTGNKKGKGCYAAKTRPRKPRSDKGSTGRKCKKNRKKSKCYTLPN